MEDKVLLTKETLKTACEYTSKLISGISTCVENLYSGDEKNAMGMMVQISEGIEWLLQVATLTRDSQKEEIEISELKKKLSLLLNAMENRDVVLMGDLLEYEVKPVLEKWREQFELNYKNIKIDAE